MSNARPEVPRGPGDVAEPGLVTFILVFVTFILAGLFRPPWWLRKSASSFRRQ